MEMTVSEVARQYDRSERFVQMALAHGSLSGHRRHGRQTSVDDIAARAWSRSLGRGRTWSPATAEAALDLLSTGTTDQLDASARSRLRSRLRGMSAREIAYAVGGLGPWARYRGMAPRNACRVGPSAVSSELLGLVAGADWMIFIRTVDLDAFEIDHDVVLDADGNLGVLERSGEDDRHPRVLLDTYLLGDARQSAAAGSALEELARG